MPDGIVWLRRHLIVSLHVVIGIPLALYTPYGLLLILALPLRPLLKPLGRNVVVAVHMLAGAILFFGYTSVFGFLLLLAYPLRYPLGPVMKYLYSKPPRGAPSQSQSGPADDFIVGILLFAATIATIFSMTSVSPTRDRDEDEDPYEQSPRWHGDRHSHEGEYRHRH